MTVASTNAAFGSQLERAHQKRTGENNTRAELEQGTLLGEVYRKYGVL